MDCGIIKRESRFKPDQENEPHQQYDEKEKRMTIISSDTLSDTHELPEDPQEIIEKLHLAPLEAEGGLVNQTYLSTFKIEGAPAGTSIYYLLRGESFSHLHQLTGDEQYHFYLGDPVELTELMPDGTFKTTILGQDILAGQEVQHLVPAGNWQGSRLAKGGKWALLGTTMWPGYTDACYTHGNAEDLLKQYPEAEEKIRDLTGNVSY